MFQAAKFTRVHHGGGPAGDVETKDEWEAKEAKEVAQALTLFSAGLSTRELQML